jgi:hypothetical protein
MFPIDFVGLSQHEQPILITNGVDTAKEAWAGDGREVFRNPARCFHRALATQRLRAPRSSPKPWPFRKKHGALLGRLASMRLDSRSHS